MKRDMDFCRKLLLEIEACDRPYGVMTLPPFGEVDEDTTSYHLKLLYEAGLIEAIDASSMNSFKWHPISLTWEGHEFLDAARDDKRWEKAKNTVINATGGLAFEFMKRSLFQVVGL